MRRAEGIDLKEYAVQFKRDLYKDNHSQIDLWVEKGLCRLDERLRLSADGFFLSDQILSNIN
jgi:coproporphyrinogen III oxidase-like Fe-S oxidoreductase